MLRRHALLPAAFAAIATLGVSAQDSIQTHSPVLLISVDGMRPDYVTGVLQAQHGILNNQIFDTEHHFDGAGIGMPTR